MTSYAAIALAARASVLSSLPVPSSRTTLRIMPALRGPYSHPCLQRSFPLGQTPVDRKARADRRLDRRPTRRCLDNLARCQGACCELWGRRPVVIYVPTLTFRLNEHIRDHFPSGSALARTTARRAPVSARSRDRLCSRSPMITGSSTCIARRPWVTDDWGAARLAGWRRQHGRFEAHSLPSAAGPNVNSSAGWCYVP